MSLRDQLLKAGLVNEKQAKQAVKQKQKQNRMEHRGQAEKDRSQELAVQQAQAGKTGQGPGAQSRSGREEEAQGRAGADQAADRNSRLPKLTTEDYYNFVDDKKVKRLSVNVMMRDKLSKGSLAIVRYEGRYEVVPRATAERIQERDPKRVVLLNVQSGEPDRTIPTPPTGAGRLMW